MRNFRKLRVWMFAIELTKEVYSIVSSFPKEEKYGLVSQMTRASVSVASNIAEGCSRRSQADYKRFLEYSIGSLFEIETQMIIAKEIGYVHESRFNKILDMLYKEEKMLNSLISKIINEKKR
ncbi:MAG: four helix bundle protein [Bacteroidales bacterium]|nr:four helix bundle protein [Bacteroidales bacterium]